MNPNSPKTIKHVPVIIAKILSFCDETDDTKNLATAIPRAIDANEVRTHAKKVLSSDKTSRATDVDCKSCKMVHPGSF